MTDLPPVEVECQRCDGAPASADGRTYTCPGCQAAYTRLGDTEHGRVHVSLAVGMCRQEFGVSDDQIADTLWLGIGPQCVFAAGVGRYNVYLIRDSNPHQHMIQAAHEAFHRVCTPVDHPYHWAHEMLAVQFSLRYLEQLGEGAYAAMNRDEKFGEKDIPQRPPELLAILSKPYPPGTFSAVLEMGDALINVLEWEPLKPLALARDASGRPSVEAWLKSLPKPTRAAALAVLPPVLARDWPTPL